ncbi:MAG TPA: endonuclease/exonuclease/phosphatase family protein [Nannocystaceae bacterium]|nr:endonuclease/exonuclease/phosphatase family protein [Nannocystaceae bacterium]
MTIVRRELLRLGGAALLVGCRGHAFTGPARARVEATLRVMTLNLAHGRARALAQSRARPAHWFRANLDAIAAVIRREGPDLVALQEAELGSRWAGDFDHVAYLAERCELPAIAATPHVRSEGRFRYGTALLGRVPWLDHGGHDFAAQGRWHKGYSWATTCFAGTPLTAISLHLDFASAARRRAQARELAAAFADRTEPLLVLGDYNDEWRSTNSPVSAIATALVLHTVEPAAHRPATYASGRRLDWILASTALRFRDHRVVPDRISDHYAVLADVAITSSNRSISAGCT